MTATSKSSPSEKHSGVLAALSNPAFQIAAAFATMLVVIWVGIFFHLQSERKQALADAEHNRESLTRAFAEHVRASLRGIDLSLIALREKWLSDPTGFNVAVTERQNYFVQEVSFQVTITRADGMVTYSKVDTAGQPFNLADRKHFQVHRDRREDELYISEPLLGRLNKRWAVQFTRPIRGPEGEFLGVIGMSVEPEYFSRFYDTVRIGKNDVIALVKANGDVLARSSHPQQAIPVRLDRPFLSNEVDEAGNFEGRSQIDIFERAYTWRALRDFGLFVIIGETKDNILDSYYAQRNVFVAGATGISVALVFLAFLILRGIRQRLHMLAALQTSKENNRLRVTALEAVGNAVMITNTNAEIEWVNRAFETLTGYSREEAFGRSPAELVKSGLQDGAFYDAMWTAIAAGNTWRGELVNRRKDGRLYDEELVITPVKNNAGTITHFVGIKHDISERKRNEKALQQSHDLLEKLSAQVPGVIFQYRLWPDGHLSMPFATEALHDVYELAPEDVRESNAPIIARNHPEDRERVSAAVRASAEMLTPWHCEYRVVLPRRGLRWLQGDARPERLEDGGTLWHGFAADITERKNAEHALRISEQRWKFALEGAGDAVWEYNVSARTMHVSRRLYEMIGVPEGEIDPSYESWSRYVPQEDMARMEADLKAYLKGETPTMVTEHRIFCRDGSTRWLLVRGMTATSDSDGKALTLIGTQSDITERKLADEELRVAAIAFELQEGMMVTDPRGVMLRVNRAFEKLTGYSAAEAIGKTPALLQSGLQDKDFYRRMWAELEQTGQWEGELWNRKKTGEIFAERLTISAVKDRTGSITHYVGAFSDITTRKEAEEQIRNLAFYDPLTDLPNRRLLTDRVTQALAASARNGRFGALMLLDLDHFKTLNDTLGHDVGDQLLVQVAQRLTASVRECDTVARLGGDEFVVMLQDLHTDAKSAAAQTETVAAKLLAVLNKPYTLKGAGEGGYRTTPSIGITQFRGNEVSFDVLLKQADIALYQAKDAGRNTSRFYSAEMQAVLNEKAVLEAGLRHALVHDELHLHYQAQVDHEGRVVGAEALLRWHPEGKQPVPPSRFIPVAEETHLILDIGQWVLNHACVQLAAWGRAPRTAALQLAINVSARQFKQPGFVGIVRTALALSGAKPERLSLELTESAILNDVDDTVVKMHELRALGVSFSLDDFGTGYSSLSYLKLLPLDQVKIDKSFVRDIATDAGDAAIVKTIISMSDTLGLTVIAEGVETIEQLSFLKENGCRYFQGYLFGKPAVPGEFERALIIRQEA